MADGSIPFKAVDWATFQPESSRRAANPGRSASRLPMTASPSSWRCWCRCSAERFRLPPQKLLRAGAPEPFHWARWRAGRDSIRPI